MTRWLAAAVLPLMTLVAACGDNNETPTSPSDDSSTVAEPSATETFTGVVPVGGSRFYAFTVGAYGTVNLTLTDVGGAGVPTTAWLGLGIGTPDAEDCVTTSTINGPSGSAAQLTGVYAAGIYCARVFDIGNLYAPATFAVTIAHP